MRLQKYLSQAGVCSRRRAEEAIGLGQLRVNGRVARLGDRVRVGEDVVFWGGRVVLSLPKTVAVLLLHKPVGFVCSHRPQYKQVGIYDLLPEAFRVQRWLCAGRLDKDSEGLVVLSNEGSIVYKLTHPSCGVLKYYRVKLHCPFRPRDLVRAVEGVMDGGELLACQHLKVLREGRWLDLTLRQGRKWEIRRLLGVLGYRTLRLQRYGVGPFRLGRLPRGQIRELSLQESKRLLDSQ